MRSANSEVNVLHDQGSLSDKALRRYPLDSKIFSSRTQTPDAAGVLLTPQEAGGSPLLSVPSLFYCISLTPIIAGEGKAVRWVRDKPESDQADVAMVLKL